MFDGADYGGSDMDFDAGTDVGSDFGSESVDTTIDIIDDTDSFDGVEIIDDVAESDVSDGIFEEIPEEEIMEDIPQDSLAENIEMPEEIDGVYENIQEDESDYFTFEQTAGEYSEEYNGLADETGETGEITQIAEETDEQDAAFRELSEYMSAHNYGIDDFAEYSQDPVWRDLQSRAFPDYELPPLNDSMDDALGNDSMEPDAMAPDGSDVGGNSNDAGFEQVDTLLESFQEDKWNELSLDGKKQAMLDFADYVTSDTGNLNPPTIEFRDDMPYGSYGGDDPSTNRIEINANMLDDSAEAADTIAHEMWHAYQMQCAMDPTSDKGREYLDGFNNYISPEYDFEGYQNQMVEAEAREYAQRFKDRLSAMKGAK